MFLASLSIGSMLSALVPTSIWGFLLYIVLIMDIVTMVMQKESNLMLTIFLAISILSAFLDELGLNAYASHLDIGTGFFKQVMTTDGTSFANWMVGVLMFVLPLVVVGMSNAPKSRFPGILAVIAAGLFVFGRWVFSQILHQVI